MRQIDEIMRISPVIPVLVIDQLEHAVPVAEALLRGGLRVVEVTLRTPVALEALQAIRQALPELVTGAGSVITAEDIDRAVAAGAEFLVSPGMSPGLLPAAKRSPVPFLPGIVTPGEAMWLQEEGFTHLKFFPADAAGGAAMLRSIAGPLPKLRFCPTGGINADNASTYLQLPNVLCVGGSWMVAPELLRAQRWDEIEQRAAAAVRLGSV
ncbi:MAG: bifunctional 4-hydroxy-2-oxoglutarate aldolase/2-dehydro-3-deoxy-phosphogluconate aldolase [Spongiibacteraceae bacterium]|nr:bifunctional 4-hydroxy-2-oxoglutarate aldolase/2-dehydro-3-deoxy-phosphogluconate aldolase [Spongiibacteraceae bacterium]